jgi:hypothetical protein
MNIKKKNCIPSGSPEFRKCSCRSYIQYSFVRLVTRIMILKSASRSAIYEQKTKEYCICIRGRRRKCEKIRPHQFKIFKSRFNAFQQILPLGVRTRAVIKGSVVTGTYFLHPRFQLFALEESNEHSLENFVSLREKKKKIVINSSKLVDLYRTVQ